MNGDQTRIHEYECYFVKECVHICLCPIRFLSFYREYHDKKGEKSN